MAIPTPANVYFENSAPILRVEDMQRSLHFYVDQLGFKNADWGGDDFTSVNRDRAGIYLCRGDQGRGGAWVWIGVEDARRLHDELKARGVVKIRNRKYRFKYALQACKTATISVYVFLQECFVRFFLQFNQVGDFD